MIKKKLVLLMACKLDPQKNWQAVLSILECRWGRMETPHGKASVPFHSWQVTHIEFLSVSEFSGVWQYTLLGVWQFTSNDLAQACRHQSENINILPAVLRNSASSVLTSVALLRPSVPPSGSALIGIGA